MVQNKFIGFEISVSGRNDGTVKAAYIRVRNATVARTEELLEDTLVADFDKAGHLIGFEILAPVTLSELAAHVEKPMRPSFRKFMRGSAPRKLISA
jgi:uncharacterized protein YuzE